MYKISDTYIASQGPMKTQTSQFNCNTLYTSAFALSTSLSHACQCMEPYISNYFPVAVLHAKLATPKKGPRTPLRLPAKPRRLQKSNDDPGSAVNETPTCRLPWGSPLSLSILAHSMKLLMVQKDAVPTEFLGVGVFGFGLIWFHDFVSHC